MTFYKIVLTVKSLPDSTAPSKKKRYRDIQCYYKKTVYNRCKSQRQTFNVIQRTARKACSAVKA